MKLKRLNERALISEVDEWKDLLLFIRMPNFKLFRLCKIPEKYQGDSELEQVLNTLCLRKVKGTYYFHVADQDAMTDILGSLYFMNIEGMFLEPDNIELTDNYFNLN